MPFAYTLKQMEVDMITIKRDEALMSDLKNDADLQRFLTAGVKWINGQAPDDEEKQMFIYAEIGRGLEAYWEKKKK